jgi:hypothetical protein
VRLHNRYEKSGFQAVFVTYIEGDKEGKELGLTDEIAFDKKHWYVDEAISSTMKIAVVDPPLKAGADTLKGRSKRENPYFFDSYLANAFPTYIFVDDHGIIRHVQIGHSDDLEQRFAEVIERLTKTVGTGASGTR